MGAVLGVPTLTYLPYCFFNMASPVLSVLYGFTGFKVTKLDPALQPAELSEPGAPEGTSALHD
jgi:NhaC family Na+:H+ antiporter